MIKGSQQLRGLLGEAKTLQVRFAWDLRSLKAINITARSGRHIMQRNSCRRMMRLSWGHHGLFRRPCLQGPSESVQIRRKYLLYGIVNRSMWIMPQAELRHGAGVLHWDSAVRCAQGPVGTAGCHKPRHPIQGKTPPITRIDSMAN
ncbi:hypothetical protein N7485_009469 [Penicillium canescens]|nr:hypothetical protein N7485_009469 [Penicillium canescens]